MGYELKDITVRYSAGQAAIQHVNCTIGDGKWIAVIGQTGAGKSTFVQVLKGLVNFEGEFLLHGQPAKRDAKRNVCVIQEVGYVFQYPEHQLFETTVYKELAFGLKMQGLSDEQVKKAIVDLLPKVNITEDLLPLAPFQLSGGQKRRVAIASILLMKPKLLIVDEPTVGLDPVSHQELLAFFKQWQQETGATIVFVTHHMEDVAAYADEVLVFHKGQLRVHMETNTLFLQQAHIVEEVGLVLPESVQLLRLTEQLLGKKIEVDSCNEQHILQAVLPYIRGDHR